MSEEPPEIVDPYADAKGNADLAHYIAVGEEPFRVGGEVAHELGETATEHVMDELQQKASRVARQMYRDDLSAEKRAAIATDAVDTLSASLKPDIDATREQAAIDQAIIHDQQQSDAEQLTTAEKDITFLKKFASNILPGVTDGAMTVREMQDYSTNKKHIELHVGRSYFSDVQDLAMATQLNTLSIWGSHVGRSFYTGVYDSKYLAENYGSRQYKDQLSPAFIIGKRQVDSDVDVLLASPPHSANIDRQLDDVGSVLDRPGTHTTMEPFLYIIRMNKDRFRDIETAINERRDESLSPTEQRQVLDQHMWPTKESKPITVRSSTPFDKFIDKQGSIKIKYASSRKLTPQELIDSGGLEAFEIDVPVTELAEAFGKLAAYKELEAERTL